MDEKMKEKLKGIYENLSDELKEKAKACKSMDEIMELAGQEDIELPDEVLGAVSGGSSTCLDCCDCPEHVPYCYLDCDVNLC